MAGVFPVKLQYLEFQGVDAREIFSHPLPLVSPVEQFMGDDGGNAEVSRLVLAALSSGNAARPVTAVLLSIERRSPTSRRRWSKNLPVNRNTIRAEPGRMGVRLSGVADGDDIHHPLADPDGQNIGRYH